MGVTRRGHEALATKGEARALPLHQSRGGAWEGLRTGTGLALRSQGGHDWCPCVRDPPTGQNRLNALPRGSREAVPREGQVSGAEFLLYNVYRNELMFLWRFLEAVEFRGFF